MKGRSGASTGPTTMLDPPADEDGAALLLEACADDEESMAALEDRPAEEDAITTSDEDGANDEGATWLEGPDVDAELLPPDEELLEELEELELPPVQAAAVHTTAATA